MTKVRNILGLVVLAAALVGCANLAPNGPYNGDKVLYDADVVMTLAYDTVHTFVKWEYENRAALASSPEITKAADAMRVSFPKAWETAGVLREAYRENPSTGTRDAFQKAVSVLRAATSEAIRYMAAKGTL